MTVAGTRLEILLPVHNEAECIENTIREIYQVVAPQVAMRFIICEDGSADGTKEVLQKLSRLYPIRLIASDERKGYSRAIIDGMKTLDADYLLCLDSDGQCDPKDFAKFWEIRDQQDVAIGRRSHRYDSFLRKALSGMFYLFYQFLNRVPVHDPSCPFVLAQRDVVDRLVSELGEMRQGFWWEFTARVHHRGYSIRELSINHRPRAAGRTQVYRLALLPGIGYRHFVALFRIWRQTQGKR
jgi:dolichol-phosphate mannosyltransferase